MWSRDSRWAPTIERAARLLVLLIMFSTVAGALGFMQLSLHTGDDDRRAYAALVCTAPAVLGRCGRIRCARAWRASCTWWRTALRCSGAAMRCSGGLPASPGSRSCATRFDPTPALREMLGAQATVGSLTVSGGAVLAFVHRVAELHDLRFLLPPPGRLPRVSLTPGMPCASPAALRRAAHRLRDGARRHGMADRFALAGAFSVGIGFGADHRQQLRLRPRPAVRTIKVGDTIRWARSPARCATSHPPSTLRTFEAPRDRAEWRPHLGAVTNWTFSDRTRRIDIRSAPPGRRSEQ
jgi:hypothetical protein